mmetsp:Transcript_13000/g.37892  ORF Transcript_13000/g.37892 Transcript_13000/m.37892 type:complete len:207 (+) Transcript_13000:1014-1634(+)
MTAWTANASLARSNVSCHSRASSIRTFSRMMLASVFVLFSLTRNCCPTAHASLGWRAFLKPTCFPTSPFSSKLPCPCSQTAWPTLNALWKTDACGSSFAPRTRTSFSLFSLKRRVCKMLMRKLACFWGPSASLLPPPLPPSSLRRQQLGPQLPPQQRPQQRPPPRAWQPSPRPFGSPSPRPAWLRSGRSRPPWRSAGRRPAWRPRS